MEQLNNRQLTTLLKSHLEKEDYFSFMSLCLGHSSRISKLSMTFLDEVAVLFYDFLLSHPDAFDFYSSRGLLDLSMDEFKATSPHDVFFDFLLRCRLASWNT